LHFQEEFLSKPLNNQLSLSLFTLLFRPVLYWRACFARPKKTERKALLDLASDAAETRKAAIDTLAKIRRHAAESFFQTILTMENARLWKGPHYSQHGSKKGDAAAGCVDAPASGGVSGRDFPKLQKSLKDLSPTRRRAHANP